MFAVSPKRDCPHVIEHERFIKIDEFEKINRTLYNI